jgi:hypothetical protein
MWPLAGLVLAVHLALLQGFWPIFTTSRDRWVQPFTTRTIAVAPPAAPASPAPPQPAPAEPAPQRSEPAAQARPRPSTRSAQAASAPAAEARAQPATPAASAPAAAATPFVPNVLGVPQPSVMRYQVTVRSHGMALDGQARLDWWHNGQQYDLRLELSAPGVRDRVQQSAGEITEEGLAPSRFSDKSRSEQATHFDRVRGRVVFSNNQPDAPLIPGMQDRLSVVVQLSMLVAGEPTRFSPGTRIAIPTASTREAEEWVFRVEGEEDLELPGGTMRALKLERLPRKEFDQKVELWLAPRKDYAPVRLRLTNPDGGSVDQRWASTDKG